MKKVLSFALLLILPACASNRVDPSFVTPQTQYQVHEVDLQVESKCENANYAKPEEIKELFTTKITEEFCKNRSCVKEHKDGDDVIDIYTHVKYRRMSMGEAFGCSDNYGSSTINLAFEIKKNGQELSVHEWQGPLVTDEGFFGNIKKVGALYSFSENTEREKHDIGVYATGIVQRLNKRFE